MLLTVCATATDGVWEADHVPVSPSGLAQLNAQVTDSAGNSLGGQTFNQPQPAMMGLMSYASHRRDNLTALFWYYGYASEFSESVLFDDDAYWSDVAGGSDHYVETSSDPDDSPVNLTTSYPAGENAISVPWENASASASPAGQQAPTDYYWYELQNQTETQVMIEPSGQVPTGGTSLYLVSVAAMQFPYPTVFNTFFGYDLVDYPPYGYAGSIPVAPETLQINGQNAVNSGLTNDDGSVWGQTLVAAPSGANVPVTITAPGLSGNNDYTFTNQVQEVTLQSLTVVSNSATQINNSTNWAVVKTTNANNYVVVQAVLDNTNAALWANAPNAIQWTGGQPVPGNPLQRFVSTTNSVETTVTATLGTNTVGLSVWVVWGSISYNFSGPLNSDDQLSFTNFPSPRNAGSFVGTVAPFVGGVTKVEIIGSLTPSGVGSIITNGFSMNPQKLEYYSWSSTGNMDGAALATVTNATPGVFHGPTNDTALPEQTVPVNDKIFTYDDPGVFEPTNVSGYEAQAANFTNYIYFNGSVASDPGVWYSHVKMTFSAGNPPTGNTCTEGGGNPTLPTTWGDSNW